MEHNQRKKESYRTPENRGGQRGEAMAHRTDEPTHTKETSIQDPIGRGPKTSSNADNRYTNGDVRYYGHVFTDQFAKETVADYLQQQGPRYSATIPRVPSHLTSINPHKTCSPYAMHEHRLLDIQNTVREEEWAGWDDAPASASLQDLYTRKAVLEYLEDTPAWAQEDELIIIGMGPNQLKPIDTFPCTCYTPEECCWEDRLLAYQDILKDECAHGPDFLIYVDSANAEFSKEIKYTASLIKDTTRRY